MVAISNREYRGVILRDKQSRRYVCTDGPGSLSKWRLGPPSDLSDVHVFAAASGRLSVDQVRLLFHTTELEEVPVLVQDVRTLQMR